MVGDIAGMANLESAWEVGDVRKARLAKMADDLLAAMDLAAATAYMICVVTVLYDR
jgi:hypothetical protein